MSVPRKKKISEGAAREKPIKTGIVGIGAEKKEGVSVTGEADREPQIPDNPQKGANGHISERSFLNLIEKWDFKVVAVGTTVNKVTGPKSEKIVENVQVHDISKKNCPFLN